MVPSQGSPDLWPWAQRRWVGGPALFYAACPALPEEPALARGHQGRACAPLPGRTPSGRPTGPHSPRRHDRNAVCRHSRCCPDRRRPKPQGWLSPGTLSRVRGPTRPRTHGRRCAQRPESLQQVQLAIERLQRRKRSSGPCEMVPRLAIENRLLVGAERFDEDVLYQLGVLVAGASHLLITSSIRLAGSGWLAWGAAPCAKCRTSP